MNSILFDNATLRGALTALNYLQKPLNERTIKINDMYLMCASVLVDAILLHDHILVPTIHSPDYPPIVKIASDVLGSDIISPLNLHEVEVDALHELAINDFRKWPISTPSMMDQLHKILGTEADAKTRILEWDKEIRRSYPNNVVEHFVSFSTKSDIKLNIAGSSTSTYYKELLKSLGLTENKETGFATNKDTINENDGALLWLAFQTCIYDIISQLRGIPYEPHPVRGKLWKLINARRSIPPMFFDLPKEALIAAREELGQQINRVSGMREYQLDIPPLFAFTLQLASSSKEVLPIALELRNDKKVKALRSVLIEIQEALATEDWVKKVERLHQEFRQLGSDLVVEYYGAKPKSFSLSLQLTSFGIGFEIPVPQSLHNIALDIKMMGKPHLAFLHDVFQSISNIWRMSDLYDKLLWGEDKPERPRLKTIEYPNLGMLRNRAKRYLEEYGNTFSLVLLDIKDFDSINLRYGRVGGDKIIDVLDEILASILWGDRYMISRAAGDTYVILILGANKEEGISLAERINKELQNIDTTLPVKGDANYSEEIVKAELHISVASNKHINTISVTSSAVDIHTDDVDAVFAVALEGLRQN